MAQDKQNSIRILKASPTPAPKRSSMYLIAGFVGGILLSCGLFVFFIYAQDAQPSTASTTRSETTETDTSSAAPEIKPTSNLNTLTEAEDIDYPNQLNEQEMSALFKHPVNGTNTLNVPAPNSSPFANLGQGQEPKPISKEVVIEKKIHKPQAVTPAIKPLPQGVVKPALLDQLNKEIELAQPQIQATHPPTPAAQSN
jgi:hypothetical protein